MWGRGDMAPCILNFGIRWRWVVSFTARPSKPQGKGPSARRDVQPVCLKDISWPCRASNRSVVTTQTACALRAWHVRMWIVFIWHRIRNIVSMIMKSLGSMKGREWPAERITDSNIRLHYRVSEVGQITKHTVNAKLEGCYCYWSDHLADYNGGVSSKPRHRNTKVLWQVRKKEEKKPRN